MTKAPSTETVMALPANQCELAEREGQLKQKRNLIVFREDGAKCWHGQNFQSGDAMVTLH